MQRLSRANIPRGQIRPRNRRGAPSDGVALEGKRAVGVLRRGERDRQRGLGRVRLRADRRVEERAFDRVDQLDELSVYDVELAGGGGVAHDGCAGGVFRVCLEVFVEVGIFDGADPVVATL